MKKSKLEIWQKFLNSLDGLYGVLKWQVSELENGSTELSSWTTKKKDWKTKMNRALKTHWTISKGLTFVSSKADYKGERVVQK